MFVKVRGSVEFDNKYKNKIVLSYEHYDDYSFCTTFCVYVVTKNEILYIGIIKIGKKSMEEQCEKKFSSNGYSSYSIYDLIPNEFERLDDDFFSLGQTVEYYKNMNVHFKKNSKKYLQCLKDLAYDKKTFNYLYKSKESCLLNSLLRNVHIATIEQFARISRGGAELTKYDINFKFAEASIIMKVDPDDILPSNIQVIIGNNGVGKTWLLYNMVHAILKNMEFNNEELSISRKYQCDSRFSLNNSNNTFAGVIGISFSVFDDAFSSIIPKKIVQKLENKVEIEMLEDVFNKKFKYIGLIEKSLEDETLKTKGLQILIDEFGESLNNIKKDENMTLLYLKTIEHLSHDSMFIVNKFLDELTFFLGNNESMSLDFIKSKFRMLSSGHMIIILSITMLCSSIFEKTVVLIDEPETHLHPPLLSAYIRSLSFLLKERNAVAIIATHSPIILQETPSDCVHIIERDDKYIRFTKPNIETLASNTDIITNEVFGHEVIKTGFYNLLKEDKIILELPYERLGSLGQSILARNRNIKNEENK